MKVFKFYYDDCHTAFSGKDENEAMSAFIEYVGDVEIDKVEEIPECEWDEPLVLVYEDNDRDTEPFKMSIRECLEGDTPTLIFSNDVDLIY